MEDITTKQADTIWHQDSLIGTGIVRMGHCDRATALG